MTRMVSLIQGNSCERRIAMKKTMRILAFLVCVAMVLSLCACTEKPVPTTEPTTTAAPTTEPTTQPTTEPTLSMEEKAAVYTAAVDALHAADALTLTVTSSTQLDAAGQSFVSETQQKLTMQGRGTEEYLAKLEENSTYGDYEVITEEVFTAGNVYADVNDYTYCAAITAEDWLSRFAPAALLDASLYAGVELTESETGATVTFSQPAALESWLGLESAHVESASGTALLDLEGNLTGTSYQAIYSLGGSRYTVAYKVDISREAGEIKVPANAEEYPVMESLDAARVVEMAYGYLLKGQQMSVHVSEYTFTQAAAVSLNIQLDVDLYSTGSRQLMKVEQGISQNNYSTGSEDRVDITETFIDGEYSYEMKGQRPTTSKDLTFGQILDYCVGMIVDDLPLLEDLQDLKLSYLGSTYLVEASLTDTGADGIGQNAAATLFNKPSFLDDLATAKETTDKSFYLAVDAYSGLPTAMGIRYECSHTIEGGQYPLIWQVDYAYDLTSLSAYEAILEEPAPDTEPVEKAKPLFYRVTGENGQQMWLMGTIHVGDDRTGFLPKEIYDAFEASDALAIECDTRYFEDQIEEDESLAGKVAEAYFYLDQTKTKDHITDEELYEQALKLMKATGNYGMNTEVLKPYLWSNFIDNFYMRQGYCVSNDKGMEERLLVWAEELNKPVREVESNLFQIQMLTGFSEALQEEALAGSVSGDAQEYWEGVKELLDMWCEGDEAALIEYLKEDTSEMTDEERKLYDEYNKAMSSDRNAGMLDVAKQYLESGEVVFYAVGLAHLLAEDGLVFTLRDAGYTVELVEYAD